QPDDLWQRICLEQHRRWGVQPGGCYRYLLGLAAAQIASAFSVIGMPRDSQAWNRQEYQLLCNMLRLERWRQAMLLEQMLGRHSGQPGRRELTAVFEGVSGERDQRIAAWRQRTLLEMMGLGCGKEGIITCRQRDSTPSPFEMC